MSIITTFLGIRGSVVYPFCYEIDHHTFRHIAWQVAHGVLYTADRLISFGYAYDRNCFCGAPETPSHLFFECALAQSVLGWIQSLMFSASN